MLSRKTSGRLLKRDSWMKNSNKQTMKMVRRKEMKMVRKSQSSIGKMQKNFLQTKVKTRILKGRKAGG